MKDPIPILEQYITSAPSPQNALDIFRGEWSSFMPEPLAELKVGTNRLFDDPRIKWFVNEIGGIKDRTVLELGPLEGGHSYMLEHLGAKSIIAVEANTRAYLKCLIVKELLALWRVHFLCGNFVEYLHHDGPAFDVCVASGVLYHMQNPAELIALIAKRCTHYLFLWTHYYDETIISANPILTTKFTDSRPSDYNGFQHTLHRYDYQTALNWSGFCGGSAPFSQWMTRDELIKCLQCFGFYDLRVNFDDPHHPNGPALALIAKRSH